MLENGARWLKLMRSAPQLADANICVRIDGPDICCLVTQRINRGVELRVTCSLDDQDTAELQSTSSFAGDGPDVLQVDASANLSSEPGMLDAASPAVDETNLDGMVAIKLEGNERPSDLTSDTHEVTPANGREEKLDCSVSPSRENPDGSMPLKDRTETSEVSKSKSADSRSPSSTMSSEIETVAKSKLHLDRQYKCPLCTYVCYSEQYLVKHVAIHDASPASVSCDSSRDLTSFCEECNIHFMSVKTYQAHKEVYCKARHEIAQNETNCSYSRSGSEGDGNRSIEDVFVVGKSTLNGIPPVIQPQGFFAAISTNPLILLPCSLVNGQGLMPQSGIISTGAPIVLPSGITGSAVIENNGISLHPLEKVPASSTQTLNPLPKSKDLKYPFNALNKYTKNENDALDLKKPYAPERKDPAQSVGMEVSQQDSPLDLTVRKRKLSTPNFIGQHVAKRRSSFATTPPAQTSTTNSSSPEPSYIHVTGRATISPPSFSNDTSSSSGIPTLVPLPSLPVNGLHGICKISDADSPTPPVLISPMEPVTQQSQSMIPLGSAPAKLLKQGNNRCEYCNIVFYKYDNYLAHKTHYCAYRRRQLSNPLECQNTLSDITNNDDVNPGHHDLSSKKSIAIDDKTSQHASRAKVEFASDSSLPSSSLFNSKAHNTVFRCDACGVKFSTSDNLHAHQTYYCSRKIESTYARYGNQGLKKGSKTRELPCNRCDDSESHDELHCPEEWKCNFCDAVCPSLKVAKKHLLTHSEMRGFCCIVCGYRGNTLRGMRTHVYEHLNGNTSQVEDILASSIVVDSGNTFFRSADFSDEESCALQDSRLVVDESSKDVDGVPVHLGSQSSPGHDPREHDVHPDYSRSDDEQKSSKTHFSACESGDSEASSNEHTFKNICKSSDNEHSDSLYTRTLNPGALCDVVIKTEDEDTTEHITPERKTPSPHESKSIIKEDPDFLEEEIDVEKTDQDKEDSKVKLGAVTSVICRVSAQGAKPSLNIGDAEDMATRTSISPKKRIRIQQKSELKYCKSCDISFHHLSNFIAHKKFYCVSRTIESFQHETAPVQ